MLVQQSKSAVVSKSLELTPPAVRPPSALIADPGDHKVYLEWNPNLEDNLAGYYIYRKEAQDSIFKRVVAKSVKGTEFIDRGLRNSELVQYRVSAMLKNGVESRKSNTVEVTPKPVEPLVVIEGGASVSMPGFDSIEIRNAVTVIFENGHRLVFDRDLARVRDWQTAEGTHLLYPLPYGNPIDITTMDEFGFQEAQPATSERPALPLALTLDYFRTGVQQLHPWWVGYTVLDNRITFLYRIPITTGYRMQEDSQRIHGSGWVTLWETWAPLERVLPGGTHYQGLSRKIELEIPSYYQEGYSVCLNDGFGVNGSADQAVTYELQCSSPDCAMKETHWQKGKDKNGVGIPRTSRQAMVPWKDIFHPSPQAVQVHPFLFVRFPQGTLLLSPRRYYYSTSYSWTNYATHGKDGLWPNYAVDAAKSGEKTSIETFEYLWSPDTSLQPPQQFIDATFFYRGKLADLYDLQRHHAFLDYAWECWGPGEKAIEGKSESEALDILRRWGGEIAEKARQAGADHVGGAHELWFSSPYTVPDEIRLNPAHPINCAIADMTAAIHKQGLGFGYWVRPEFVKQPYPMVMSSSFYTTYYGYVSQLFPQAIPIIEREGLVLIRKHPEWIRRGRGGTHPTRTPYNWTPMSLTIKGWYEEVVYKTLVMMKKLGVDSIFQDGGFSNMPGVDYTSGSARAVQPYYWRFYQDINCLGLQQNGENMTGWVTSNLHNLVEKDTKHLWAFAFGNHRGNLEGDAVRFFTPELRHISHQLYIGAYLNLSGDPRHAEVARFAQKFLEQNGHPKRVFLEGLKWEESEQMWKWENVWWEYGADKRVRYPNYHEVIR